MTTYNDDDFVYVDTNKRCVVGIVKWGKDGNPVPLEREDSLPAAENKSDDAPKKKIKFRKKKTYYPWGSYRAMKKLYRLEGKVRESEGQGELDEVLKKSLKDVYWD